MSVTPASTTASLTPEPFAATAIDRGRLYDEETRDSLRFGAPLIAGLLSIEGLAHFGDGPVHFTALALTMALCVAPVGWIARRPIADRLPPVRYWGFGIWALCLTVLYAHLAPFSFESTTYLIVGLLFGCASMIVTPLVFMTTGGGLVLTLGWWLWNAPSFEIQVFALLCVPLAAFVFYARHRSLLLGEQKRVLEAELLRQSQEVAAVRRVLAINGGLSHRFNNIFAGVITGSSVALDMLEAGHPARGAVEAALTSGERGGALIERLGLSGDPAQEARVRVPLQTWLEEIAAERPLPPTLEIEADLHSVTVQPERMARALTELLANAEDGLQHGPDARPDAGAVRLVARRQGTNVEIVVEDTGAGMDPQAVELCREPFYTRGGPDRIGLGLSYAVAVIEHHAGSLHIDSTPGVGTRVRVLLPAQ